MDYRKMLGILYVSRGLSIDFNLRHNGCSLFFIQLHNHYALHSRWNMSDYGSNGFPNGQCC